jgi:cystathionine beta-lyase/cystathionine gamma-synthase
MPDSNASFCVSGGKKLRFALTMADTSFNTLAVHAGVDASEHFGAVSTPIYPASIFAFEDADEGAAIHNELKPGYYYGRLGNPTTEALERTIAELENGVAALAFASGMAAISASILTFVKPGDEIVAPRSMYATTTKLFAFFEERFDITTTFVDALNAENYAAAATSNTKIFWIETPSNPVVQITDISAVTAAAKAAGILTIADNTFATPYNQRPIELGVDIVAHSATKYLGGHSDLTAGLLISNKERITAIRDTAVRLFGGNIAPQVAWLVMRGIKTLALRMESHNQNASELAAFLATHPKVRAVHYPGLPDHPNHEIAERQMRGFGGMIGLDVGTVEAGKAFVNSLKLATLATSLGGVETIVQHSASMTHAAIPAEVRQAAGISDGLIRVSVGIEDIADLKTDFESALSKI